MSIHGPRGCLILMLTSLFFPAPPSSHLWAGTIPDVTVLSSGRNDQRHLLPHACVFSRVRLFATPWTVAQVSPLNMGFSRQEYWSELPFPPPRDLPHPGIKPESPVANALAGRFFHHLGSFGMGYKDEHLILTLDDPMNCSPPGSSVHGFSRQEYWSELPFPPPADLPNPGIEPTSSRVADRFFTV